MTNNDFLRSFRYALELDPSTLAAFFAEGGAKVALARVAAMLKDDGEAGFEPLGDELLGRLLDGVISAYRGPREAGQAPDKPTAQRMTNNRILRSLRIAFELRDTDIQAFMEAAGRAVSKAELGALFRREDHRNYQPCGDQFMRAFLRGLGLARRKRPEQGPAGSA
jgi:uncharacterized protein YehS (DUF1456 family)